MITLTEMAAKKISDLRLEEGKPEWGLRIRIVGGGCSGMSYELGWDDAPADDDDARDEKERRSNQSKRVRAIVEILTHPEKLYKENQLAEALLEHDEHFALWRSHHIKMVERMVGTKPGTGGSEGVGYLQKTLDKKFFPELWEARTFLGTQHDEKGCPFAK